jgi:OPT oligopeptide transporter protein
LGGKLNWTLLVIGAMIAVTLELCGISSLAFAVGVYVPIRYSVPIFLGGLVRWALDALASRIAIPASTGNAAEDAEARARAEVAAIARTESSPGVLMASGYIAGGSLAGVLIAFLQFAPKAFLDEYLDYSKSVEGMWLNSPSAAIIFFGALIAVLAIVGSGKLFGSPPDKPQARVGNGDPEDTFRPGPPDPWNVTANRIE